jgi:hypothetical protein
MFGGRPSRFAPPCSGTNKPSRRSHRAPARAKTARRRRRGPRGRRPSRRRSSRGWLLSVPLLSLRPRSAGEPSQVRASRTGRPPPERRRPLAESLPSPRAGRRRARPLHPRRPEVPPPRQRRLSPPLPLLRRPAPSHRRPQLPRHLLRTRPSRPRRLRFLQWEPHPHHEPLLARPSCLPLP